MWFDLDAPEFCDDLPVSATSMAPPTSSVAIIGISEIGPGMLC